VEDRQTAAERAVAHELLQDEREARRRALAALLDAERGATDERLHDERERADHRLATRDEFLGMVSHDLRGLLSGIAMEGAQLAKQASRQGDAGLDLLRRAERVQRFTARMARLVADLLDVVSLEAGELTVTPAPMSVEQLLEEALETFQPAFVAKGLTLRGEVRADVGVARLDRERILQVLANLLGNSLKFTSPGGHVSMTVRVCEAGLCFSVIDDGIGIPEDELTNVFGRFHQAKTRDRRGLGLGLYIARSLVQAHGGRIWAERPDQGGTAVHFTLPAADTTPLTT
jgi:signal transduction histidine kinase